MTKLLFPSNLGIHICSEVTFNTKLFTNNQGYEERIAMWHKPKRRFYPAILELPISTAQKLEEFFLSADGKLQEFALQHNGLRYQVRFEQDQLTITPISQKICRVSELSMIEIWS